MKEELALVSKLGCANSRSKAKCLQIAGNLKDKEAEEKAELQAKGITAPKFLIEMQARALDRQMRHEEAHKRREALEREKETMRIAAEEEKVLVKIFFKIISNVTTKTVDFSNSSIIL